MDGFGQTPHIVATLREYIARLVVWYSDVDAKRAGRPHRCWCTARQRPARRPGFDDVRIGYHGEGNRQVMLMSADPGTVPPACRAAMNWAC